MKVKDRNSNILKILYEHLEAVHSGGYQKDESFTQPLKAIFDTKSWGFREIILVITIASMLDKDFKASQDFYACNPRALYEGSIREFLRDQRIPHRKSGPLNVAKNIDSIDKNWARGKRPEDAALAVAEMVQAIEQMNESQLSNFLSNLLQYFIDVTIRVDKLSVEIDPIENPLLLHSICKELIDNTPDRGNTAQRICGLVLKNYIQSKESNMLIDNFEDSASTTNTTSKKPGDIILEGTLDNTLEVYEVTCKKFDEQRIHDSYESIKNSPEKYSKVLNEIYVICRKQDCPSLQTQYDSDYLFGAVVHADITYYFINLYEWTLVHLLNMTKEYRRKFHEDLSSYITHPNTAEDVKVLWQKINVM